MTINYVNINYLNLLFPQINIFPRFLTASNSSQSSIKGPLRNLRVKNKIYFK